MSEVPKLSSSEIKNWLQRETGSAFTPVHSKAQQLRDEMVNALDNFKDASRMLFDNSGKEIEKRNKKTYGRARALNKLARLFVDRIEKVKVPEQISYDSLHNFAQEVEKVFSVTDVDIKKWFPRISPYFILDRRKFLTVYEKSKESLKILDDFLTREYVKTKTLEETFQLIDKLQTLEKQSSELKKQKTKAESEKSVVENEIAESQQKLDELKTKSAMSQLYQINRERVELRKEVKHRLRHLQKPFKKMQVLTLRRGGADLTQDELSKLGQYLEKPFEAFATEETGYPMLKQILQKLHRSMAEGKLKLKREKARKAEQALSNILNKQSLANLHKKCADLRAQRKQLLASTEMEETKRVFSKLKEQIGQLEIRRGSIEAHEKTIERECNETLERILNNRSEIEQNVLSFLDEKVQIV